MLEELGLTPQEVAAALRARGVRGIRNTVRFLNPVVRYAHARIPEARGIDVIQRDAMRIVFADGREEVVSLPDPVRRFLDAFDRGEFPDLEMPDEGG